VSIKDVIEMNAKIYRFQATAFYVIKRVIGAEIALRKAG
jgi:hypothetical protein